MKITRMIITGAAAAALAVNAYAALSQQYVDFGKGPAQWIMTKDEQAKWKSINDDTAAQAFIDLFWARRDPTPATIENEFHDQFDARVKYADDHFVHGKQKGSMTDRGRALIILGAPTTIQRSSPEPKSTIQVSPNDSQVDNIEGGSIQSYSPKQVWVYESNKTKTPLPSTRVEIGFIDQYGGEDWKLERTSRTDVVGLINSVNQASITQPNLTEAPKLTQMMTAPAPAPAAAAPAAAVAAPAAPAAPAIGSFKTDALRAAVDEARARKNATSDKLYVTYGEYITPKGEYFVPVQLYVPKVAGLTAEGDYTFFGMVEDASGKPAAIFEEPAKLTATKNDLFFDKSLTLAPGTYKGTFGIAQGGKPVSIVTSDLTLAGLDKDKAGISGLLLSNNVYALPAAQAPTDPFAFGGIKVVPKADRAFTKDDELWYFFELRNPGIDPATSKPKVRAKLTVEGKTADGKPIKYDNPPMEVDAQALAGVPGHFAVGQSIPLLEFKPGDYTLRVKVTDTVSSQTYDLSQPFKVSK
jgi:GWxTD domain-containing protein